MKSGFRSPRPRPDGNGEGADGPFAPHQIRRLVKSEFDRSKRYGHPLVVGVLKVDRLEALVDHHGHRVRDVIQTTVTRVLQRELRSSDLLGRHPEDRFLVLLPHVELAGAQEFARRVLRRIAEFQLEVGPRVLNITATMGLAGHVGRSNLFCDQVLAQAEAALERGRAAGGNRIELAADGPEGAGEPGAAAPDPEPPTPADPTEAAPRPPRRLKPG